MAFIESDRIGADRTDPDDARLTGLLDQRNAAADRIEGMPVEDFAAWATGAGGEQNPGFL